MDKRELKIDYSSWSDSCPEGYEKLCREAINASLRAYSVYSHFSVGAAVLLENGEVITGNNQENGAYPCGICAERTALAYAGATRPGVRVKALAIAATEEGVVRGEFVPPCGACRQVMMEVVRRYGKDFDVIMVGRMETVVIRASALLPFAFRLQRDADIH